VIRDDGGAAVVDIVAHHHQDSIGVIMRVARMRISMIKSLASILIVPALALVLGCNGSSSTSGTGGAGGSAGSTGGSSGGTGGGGGGACGGVDCTSAQICVHPQCLNCQPPPPAPFCVDVPSSCGATPTCACFPFTVCQRNGQAGGACISINARDLSCG
jgi:hypothetical protein